MCSQFVISIPSPHAELHSGVMQEVYMSRYDMRHAE